MFNQRKSQMMLLAITVTLMAIWELQCAEANPAIFSEDLVDLDVSPTITLNQPRTIDFGESYVGFDATGVCIRNCAQCKKMYGPWFQGSACADACLKFSGKMIPDCNDPGSIAPFLNKIE